MIRSCDAASDVLSRDPPRIRPLPRGRGRIPFASDRRTLRRRCLVKGRGLSLGRDAFHRRVLPPPVAPPAFASDAWDHEEPATGVAARVLVALATATRLPAPFRPRRSRGTGARELDPSTFRSGPSAARRLLQPPQSASTPARSPDPRLVQPERALARSARRPRCREARRRHRHARPKPRVMMTAPAPSPGGDVPAVPSPAFPEHACAYLDQPARAYRTLASRVFTGQERPRRGPPLFPGVALAGDRRRVLSQPDPLGHLSSWNRCRAGWRLRLGRERPFQADPRAIPPRAASLAPPRRGPRPAAPEVPSIDEQDTGGRPRTSPERPTATAKQSFMVTRDGLLPTACCQPVENVLHVVRSRWIHRP